ncbi:hypothetical protein PMIN01_02580 [Paraphaeosphaeria minitans]|uniref:CMP/dCMP-type deaminase domain-containing protein n=1 Tax=Paraphaeosphaeria minitans TaxID=565426 RepID=A0A9P6KV32_9PLEO|nr:hypothetical protein PMIN01_02580 [Paraphaeosphaeria minitans]
MKTDHYLNLCLEQAVQSPLHYRHRCIIVQGGKVIGQGFNDHRAGFDGGALKTGTIPSEEVTIFTPFEAMGGGKLANTPLSMHSEMMVVHSALSASATLATTASRLQRDAIKTYVETMCKAALAQSTEQRVGRPAQEWRFEGVASQSDVSERGAGSGARSCVARLRGTVWRNTEGEIRRTINTRKIITRNMDTRNNTAETDATTTIGAPHATGVNTTSIKHHETQKKPSSASAPPKSHAVLVPKGRTGEKKRSTVDRKKHPRLNGADLYVARHGWQSSAKGGLSSCCDEVEYPETTTAKRATGSLHEELLNPGARSTSAANKGNVPEPSVLASRPCYRCIAYMNSVGIKRVFWTTSSGEWECAKVRDWVDALDNLGSGDAADAPTLGSVFVTKHEVLMLRRTMGGDVP